MNIGLVRLLVILSFFVLPGIFIPLGDFKLGSHVFILFVVVIFGGLHKQLSAAFDLKLAGIVALFLFLFFVITSLFTPCEDFLLKSVISLCLFIAVIFLLQRLSLFSRSLFSLQLIQWAFVLNLFAVVGDFFFTGNADRTRVGGFFLEPSHLALSITPLIMALMFSDFARQRVLAICGFITLFVFAPSATLAVLFALSLIVCSFVLVKGKRDVSTLVGFVISFVVLVAIFYLSPYGEEFIDRVNGVFQMNDDSNISSLVYLNGWQTAFENFKNSNYVGLGFNRMGCSPRPITEVGYLLGNFDLEDLNFNDGSFHLAKVISEFGIFGILFWLGLIGFLFKSFKWLHEFRDNRAFVAFILSGLVVMIVGGVVRGAGYFSGPFMFGVYCVFVTFGSRQKGSVDNLKK